MVRQGVRGSPCVTWGRSMLRPYATSAPLRYPGNARLTGENRLQQARHRHETAVHWVGGQAKALEREHAEDWLRPWLPEHDDGRPRAVADANRRPRHGISHLAAVGQLERTLPLRCHAEPLEHVPRDPRVCGTGVHYRVDA